MIAIGSVVMKIAGRDAGRLGVVIDVQGEKVLIDGQVRRREVSVNHIEPINQTVDVAQNASTETVREALKGIGVEFPEPFANKRERKGGEKPVKQRAADKKPAKAPSKKSPKKAPAKKAKPAKEAAPKPTEKQEKPAEEKPAKSEPEAKDSKKSSPAPKSSTKPDETSK